MEVHVVRSVAVWRQGVVQGVLWNIPLMWQKMSDIRFTSLTSALHLIILLVMQGQSRGVGGGAWVAGAWVTGRGWRGMGVVLLDCVVWFFKLFISIYLYICLSVC